MINPEKAITELHAASPDVPRRLFLKCAAGAAVTTSATANALFSAVAHDQETAAGLPRLRAILQAEPLRGLYARTYNSMCDRVQPDGYFQESLTTAYSGEYPRTVGALVPLFVETGEASRARRLVDFVLKVTSAVGMNRIPHVIEPPQTVSGQIDYRTEVAREDQLDGTFHNLLAWAIVAQTWPDRAWEDATWSEVARLSDVATDWPYLTPMYPLHGMREIEVGLFHNFCLEHSREGRYWDCWDILTQSFGCAALRKLSEIAETRGDNTHARKYRATYQQVESAVKTRLSLDINGEQLYAEMRLPDGGAGTIFPGLSWLNFAPLAAQWGGVDANLLGRTLQFLRQKASFEWQGYKLMGNAWRVNGHIERAMPGKLMAWEMVYALQEKDYNRICTLLEFIGRTNTAPLLAETFDPQEDGTVTLTDPGNGEQCAWWCWAMAKARKAAGLPPSPA